MSHHLSTRQAILALLEASERQGQTMARIEHYLNQLIHRPVTLHLWLKTTEDRYHSRSITLATIGQTAVATVTEIDAQGASVPVTAANITFTSSDPTVATVVANGDGTATVTAVAAGTVTITATDTVNGLTGQATAVVDSTGGGGGTPSALTLTLGEFSTPAAPAAPAATS